MAAIKAGRYLNKTNLYHITHFIRSYGVRNSVRKVRSYLTENRAYAAWFHARRLTGEEEETQRRTERDFLLRPKISILVPTYNTAPEFLRQMIESVIGQTYTGWELCIADGSPDHSKIRGIAEEYQQKEIRFAALEENLGISGNTNAALKMATGDYIALLDHDDILEKNALFEIVKAVNKNAGTSDGLSCAADVIYTDEDMLRSGSDAFYHNPAFKPDFNSDYLNSCNYITHFYVVKREIALAVGGFSTDCDGSQDYDFILKTTERAKTVLHIPKVLYHWRVHMNSVAGNPEDKMYAYDSAVRALDRHYQRLGISAHAEKDTQLGFYRTTYEVSGQPKVSVICHNCPSSLKQDLQKQISYANYEFVDRASKAEGEYLLFLNHIEKIESSLTGTDFVSLMLANCQRSEVGLVGVKVLDVTGHVSECGLYYTADGSVYSPFRGLLPNEPGYYGIAENQHFVSLTGPSCFMIARDRLQAFRAQDIYHLCMDLCEAGLHVTVIPQIHAISTRKARSTSRHAPVYRFTDDPPYLQAHPQDPYYTPNFSQNRSYEL